MEPRSEFEERLDALTKTAVKSKEERAIVLEKKLETYREWVEARGRLIIFLRDELVKVADFNEHLANTLEAVCAENEHLARKLVEMEVLAEKFYLETVKMEAEYGFSVGEKISRKMLGKLFQERMEQTFF